MDSTGQLTDISAPIDFNTHDVTPPPLQKEKWTVQSLALDLSGSCNLSCRYCAEAASQPVRRPMDVETIGAALNYLFPGREMKCNTTLRFGSGEPLMALPLLKEIEKRLKRISIKNKTFVNNVFLTTNGTLIDDEVREWLISTLWHVKMSFDGPKSIQDHWRITKDKKGTYDKIKPVIETLAKKMKQKFSTTAVLCKDADPQVVFDESAALGVQRIELVPVVNYDEAVYPDHSDIEKYTEFVQNHARTIAEKTGNKRIPGLTRFSDRVCRVMGYNNFRIPCGAGRNFYGVGPDGALYPCFRFIGIEKFILGNVYSGLDHNAVNSFLSGPGRPYEKRTSCSKCWAAPLCGGPCFACSELFGPGNGEPLPVHCAYVMADAKAAVWLVNTLRKKNPVRLLSFLPEVARVI
jgi:uncharacterized protein